jgi:ferritin-like metal-binding protein YciE
MAELIATPRELFAARLRQMLWIELQLAEEVLPQLLEQAHATELRFGFERHLFETRDHVDTLRAILHELHVPADPQESPALKGLVKEHEQLSKRVSEGGPLVGDLALAQSATAGEHLEIAAYDSLVSVAEALDEESIGMRLREMMEQEQFALEQIDRATTRILAEQIESERL